MWGEVEVKGVRRWMGRRKGSGDTQASKEAGGGRTVEKVACGSMVGVSIRGVDGNVVVRM